MANTSSTSAAAPAKAANGSVQIACAGDPGRDRHHRPQRRARRDAEHARIGERVAEEPLQRRAGHREPAARPAGRPARAATGPRPPRCPARRRPRARRAAARAPPRPPRSTAASAPPAARPPPRRRPPPPARARSPGGSGRPAHGSAAGGLELGGGGARPAGLGPRRGRRVERHEKSPRSAQARGRGRSPSDETDDHPPSARRKKRRPSVGLLTRGARARKDFVLRGGPPLPRRGRVGSRGLPPLTVAGPRRTSTGFPFMPETGTEGAYSVFRLRSRFNHPPPGLSSGRNQSRQSSRCQAGLAAATAS